MKKTNTKASKSSAPTTAPTKPKKKTPAVNGVSAAPASAVSTAVSAPIAASAPAVKSTASTPVKTKIVARIDVGFGNALYVRGDGPGLTWNQGVPMECVASDQWELVLGESARPISFKLLLNDTTWCTGPDSTLPSGETITITPEFV